MSTGETLIKVEGVSKKFCRKLSRSMYYGMVDSGRNMLGIPYQTDKLRKDEFWALKDINFELKRGETLGIIGQNGSGKSTLLRVLNGIFPPDKGLLKIKGRIGALIAVGAGFHPHMTGRENIFLNGAILGMSRINLEKKFNEIIEFAEIDDFLDAPVSTYSSGMKVRLGFAVAIHINPDILLIDEVLSVGDIGFRNKSLKYMQELLGKTKGIIFISHNLDQVQYICDKTIVLEQGGVSFYGSTYDAIRYYEQNVYLKREALEKRGVEFGTEMFDIQSITINENTSKECSFLINQQEKINITLIIQLKDQLINFTPTISCTNENKIPLFYFYANEHGLDNLNYKPGEYKFNFKIPPLHLKEGIYDLHFSMRSVKSFETKVRIDYFAELKINGTNLRQRDQFLLAPRINCSINYLNV